MPRYHKLGNVPHKRHTTFRKKDGTLHYEQLFGTVGFDGMSSLLYHLHPPTQVKDIKKGVDVSPKIAVSHNMKMRAFKGFQLQNKLDFLFSRTPVLTNSDVTIHLASPKQTASKYFYKNVDADEVIFVHKGEGILKSQLGQIDFFQGDYLVIPRGIIYNLEFKDNDNRHFIIESKHPIYTPKRYRNWFGQHLEHAPFCERDLRVPKNLKTYDEKGDFLIKIKKEGFLYDYTYSSHPYDVVGWDGYNYPYAFSIHDFEPITGRVHQPPPVHQTFETPAFVICSFCPRLYDYHPDAIPAPYNHSNIDSDEVLYYVDGDFMSRNDIEVGQITLHPSGIPHGPHPGAYERSIGKKLTEELAVMVDTFKPLKLTVQALELEVKDYYKSWIHD
ncbi:MAG: homogentisate 1,2-dioxygenase [Flavobacteriales bacterium]|nr:homogentisate 1,2-dioxygenase [Flavobacteriales bacterium]